MRVGAHVIGLGEPKVEPVRVSDPKVVEAPGLMGEVTHDLELVDPLLDLLHPGEVGLDVIDHEHDLDGIARGCFSIEPLEVRLPVGMVVPSPETEDVPVEIGALQHQVALLLLGLTLPDRLEAQLLVAAANALEVGDV